MALAPALVHLNVGVLGRWQGKNKNESVGSAWRFVLVSPSQSSSLHPISAQSIMVSNKFTSNYFITQ